MTFEEAVAKLPLWVQIWVQILGGAAILTPVALVFWRKTWRDAAILAASLVVIVVLMQLLYAQVGMVRLLGLPHIVVWTPIAYYVWVRIRHGELPRIPQIIMAIFLACILISLVFDFADVARWVLGERESLVPTG